MGNPTGKKTLFLRKIGRAALAGCLAAALCFGGWPKAETPAVYAREEEEQQGDTGFQGQLYARSAVLMDGDSGRVLYEKEGDVPRAMASTTKIMTCILALEYMENDRETVTASENAAGQPKVRLGVRAGEEYDLRDLLYSLMLESHNDSAVMIAEHIGGSVQGFASLMNEKVRELGCQDTHFVTPNGLDASDEGGIHATTARDLAAMMKYCIRDSEKSQEFLEITGTKSYQFQDLSGSRSFACSNHNAFLSMMEGALSGKTGFTADAGYCYVGALTRDGKTLIVALLACSWPNRKNDKWSDTRALMEYGLAQYSYRNLWKEVQLPDVSVEEGVPDDGSLSGPSSLSVEVKAGSGGLEYLVREDEEAEILVDLAEEVKAPVEEGEVLGEIFYRLGGEVIGNWPIVAKKRVLKRDYRWCAGKIIYRYIKIDQ